MPMKIDYAYSYRIFVYLEECDTEIELINEWILFDESIKFSIVIILPTFSFMDH